MSSSFDVPEDFVAYVKDHVRSLQLEYPHANSKDAFTHWASQLAFSELDSDEIYNLVLGVEANYDMGVDLAYRDDKNGTHFLVKALYPLEPTTLEFEAIRNAFSGFELLSTDSASIASTRLYRTSQELKESIEHQFELRFCFMVFGVLNPQALDEIQQRVSAIPNASYVVYDIKQLYELHFSSSGVLYETQDIQLELPLFSGKSRSIVLDELRPYSVVANVDLLEYARKVTPYIPRIFDANVRHPLKNKINRGIEATITDPEMRQYFWHYNNGLTILVNEIVVDSDRVVVKGPTIVNGCQTTATLSNTIRRLGNVADNIRLPLLVRFIKVRESEETSKLRIDIAKYTNSQAPVVIPDFKSNEEEQERVAHLFTMLEPPVFYERKRGQWDTLSRTEKAKFSDHVSMVEIAQQWYSFRASPTYAIVSKNGLFEDTGIYRQIFTPPRSAAEYYMAHLLFDQFGDYLLRKKQDAEGKSDSDSLLFLDLARARNLVVAHLINLVGELMLQKYGEFSADQARSVLVRVKSGEISSSLQPLLEVVVTTFNMSLTDEEVLTKEWRNPATIGKLKMFLKQQVTVFGKARINVLDFV